MRHICGVLLALAYAAPRLGATDTRATPKLANPPALLRSLQQSMMGQPVIGVGLPETVAKDNPATFGPDESLLKRLQAIGESSSTRFVHLIPYAVGSAWVLAPEEREEFTLPDRNAGLADYLDRRSALTYFLASLTPGQVKQLGSPVGLPAGEVGGLGRSALQRALHPPLAIAQRQEQVDTPRQDDAAQAPQWQDVGRLEEPLGFSSLRIFGRLAARSVEFQAAGNYVSISVLPPQNAKTLRPEDLGTTIELYSSLEVPPLATVPNRYKPSDLSGTAIRPPIGVDGIHSVKDVVDAAASATGLTLHVIPMWKDLPVFIGSKNIPSGEVLDGLCLALEGAWRKLGPDYLLAWDVRGLAPLQRWLIEAMQGINDRSERLMSLAQKSQAWIQMAEALTFDETNSLSLTEEQRRMVFPVSSAGVSGIRYPGMTPSQQEWVRTRARTEAVTLRVGNDEPYQRPLTDEEITTAAIYANFDVVVSVEEPSTGRLNLDPEFGRVPLVSQNAVSEQGLAEAAKLFTATPAMMNGPAAGEETKKPAEEDGTDETDAGTKEKDAPELGTPAIPSPVRAVMVPPLGPGMLNDLISTMRRHGFNLLFYPALYDGFATMPGAAFPIHPAVHGKDGLEAALSAAKGTGIRVAAYLNTLTWRGPDQPRHWLAKHRAWLEQDMLGRCRSEWLADHPLAADDGIMDPAIDRDYVRAADMEVASKLNRLLKDVSSRSGLCGLALCDWLPVYLQFNSGSSNGILDERTQPPMGYAPADRYAIFGETGMDPVDRTLWSDPPFLPRTMEATREDLASWRLEMDDGPWGKVPFPANRALISSLLNQAKGLRPDWDTYLFEYADAYRTLAAAGSSKPPKGKPPAPATMPDHTIGTILLAGENADGVNLPVTSEAVNSVLAGGRLKELHGLTDAIRNGEWRAFSLFIPTRFLQEDPEAHYDPPRITVLNFQRAPEIMNDILRAFRPPTAGELAPPKKTQEAKSDVR